MQACGECTMCCITPRIPELNKPERVKCTHCTTKCNIYEERPNVCRTFQCVWSTSDWDISRRPDKCGVIIEKLEGFLFAMCNRAEWLKLHNEFKRFTDLGIPIVINSLHDGNNMVLPENMQPQEVINRIQKVFS